MTSALRIVTLAAAIAAGIVGTASQEAAESPFAGLDGRGIAELIRTDFRPAVTVSASRDIERIISSYARLSEGGYRDYFSTRPATSVRELRYLAVAPVTWWPEATEDRKAAGFDLHNIVPANSDVQSKRSDYPPGELTETVYTNGYWRSGIGVIDGMETNFYEPADELKGEFARIYMYMAAVYPQSLWEGRAPMIYLDGYYPLLTAYGRNTLMKWHRDDPVDEAERCRDEAIAAAQGHGNPFVTLPELAEYIWGTHSDETFPPAEKPDDPKDPDNPENPDKPDTPDQPAGEPIMLKATYSVASDGRIDFRSPYVAAGSTWSLDGKTVDGPSVSLDGISLGRHEIRYTNDRQHGKVIITVEP